MPEVFEVIFVDKICGKDNRTIVEWMTNEKFDFNLVVKLASAKVCTHLGIKTNDLIFRSLRVL